MTMHIEKPIERAAIVGTAQSWGKTPWHDHGLHISSLNDAYRMEGFVRADSWTDIHPIDKFFSPEGDGKKIYAHQIPVGHYVRPKDHIQWLGSQTMPVWLHPDYLTQHAPAKDWTHARPFPKADIEAEFGRYFTSSPAWMIAHLISQGCRELHIYGIHLATEHEYIEQRPNFEYLIGRLLGKGKQTVTVADGVRHYETADGHVVLPVDSPVLQSNFQYGFQARPRAALEPLRWELHKIGVKRTRAFETLKTAKPWTRIAPVRETLAYLDAWQADVQDQMARLEAAAGGF